MKLVTTSVVRGSHQGESHGGVYLIDLDRREVRQTVDWDKADIDWRGRGWDRGLRGIAFDGDTVYIAASDELFAYTPRFERIGSWRNPYLKHCHEIAVWRRRLFLTSTGCDSILGFDLATRRFTWALHLSRRGAGFHGSIYDPSVPGGPPMRNQLHVNNVHCNESGMYVSGLRTGGMLRFDGRSLHVAAALPAGCHNARPFNDGTLVNDTRGDVLRYLSRDGKSDRTIPVPRYRPENLTHRHMDRSGLARQGFARGLCVLDDTVVAAGSSPSTVAVYDLRENRRVMAVNLTMDVRNAIHGLEVWPYG